MEPNIALATVADVDELARLRWQLYTEESPSVEESFESYRDRFAAFAVEALADDDWRVWIAEDMGRLIAATWRHRVPRIPQPDRGEPAPLAYITNVYIEPAYRNGGLGSRMLHRVLDACREEGYSLALVWPSERSYPFYERAGFERPPDPLVIDLGGDWHERPVPRKL